MSATVPERILVGDSTCYCHFVRGQRDMYAPQSMHSSPPESHTWSYCVSREHNDTVYFHNESSGRSVWVLPALDPAGSEVAGAAEEMRAVGAVESAARRRRQRSATPSAHTESKVEAEGKVKGKTETEGERSRRGVVRQSVAEAVQRALVRNAVGHSSVAEERHSVRDRLATWRARRAQEQQQQQSQEPVGDVSRETSKGHTGSAQSLANSAEIAPAPMGQRLSEKETQQRKQQQQQQQQGQPTQTSLESDVYDEKRRVFLLAKEDLQREKEEALRRERSAIEHSRRCLEAQQREEEERARLARERRQLEERRVELQRRAIERQEAAIAAADAEALRRETVEQVNNYYEKARGLEEHAETEMQKSVSFESAIAKSLLDSVTGFRSNGNQSQSCAHQKHSSPDHQGNITEPSKLDQPRCIDLRILEDRSSNSSTDVSIGGDDINGKDTKCKAQASTTVARHRREQRSHALHGAAHNSSLPAEKTCERTSREGRIQYSPALVYIGGVTGLSGNRFNGESSAPLLKRQGHGKLYYDAAQKSFFEGGWVDDKRNGHGILSLPHVAVEGEWRDDMLEGRATFQTQRLKGTGEFAKGVPSGNAIVELDCNSVFAGSLRGNGEIGSGALTLGSGGHVEWIEGDLAGPSAQRNVSGQTLSGNSTDPLLTSTTRRFTKHKGTHSASNRGAHGGTGKSRIQFANGDVYVGETLNYLPHGNGSYRFAAEGNEYIGEFYKGQIHGSGTYRFADGNVYVGHMYKGLFHGEGQYVQKDTYTYEGAWEYGTAHGEGKITFANGDVWEGKFEHDKRMDGRYIDSKLFQL